MRFKTNEITIEIPAVLVLVGVLAASNMYANHCKKKSYKTMVEGVTKIIESGVEIEGEES